MLTMPAPPLDDWPGDRIAGLRKRKALTQAGMADLLGYDLAQSVSDLERERRRPSPPVRILLDLIERDVYPEPGA